MRRWGIRTVSLFVVLDFASVMNSNSAVCVCVDVDMFVLSIGGIGLNDSGLYSDHPEQSRIDSLIYEHPLIRI